MHVDGDLVGAGVGRIATPERLDRAGDGFGFLTDTETAVSAGDVRLRRPRRFVVRGGTRVRRRASRLVARRVRRTARGRTRSLSLRARPVAGAGHPRRSGISRVQWRTRPARDSDVTVLLRDGARHEHRADANGWHIRDAHRLTRRAASTSCGFVNRGLISSGREGGAPLPLRRS
jgi:hypothetical protein